MKSGIQPWPTVRPEAVSASPRSCAAGRRIPVFDWSTAAMTVSCRSVACPMSTTSRTRYEPDLSTVNVAVALVDDESAAVEPAGLLTIVHVYECSPPSLLLERLTTESYGRSRSDPATALILI